MQWEYKVIGNCSGPMLARLGLEGWELVAVIEVTVPAVPYSPEHKERRLYFKRPVQGKVTP